MGGNTEQNKLLWWVIGILGSILLFSGSLAVSSLVNANKDQNESITKLTNEVAIVKTNYDYIVRQLDRIEKKLDEKAK